MICHLSILRLLSLCLVTIITFWEKLPIVTLKLHLYEIQQEEKSKPIISYPIPYMKDLLFDIVELMEEMEERIFTKLYLMCSLTSHWNSEPSLLFTVPSSTRKPTSSAMLTRN